MTHAFGKEEVHYFSYDLWEIKLIEKRHYSIFWKTAKIYRDSYFQGE